MDRGKGTPYEGNYSAYLEQKQQRLAIEEKSERRARRSSRASSSGSASRPRARIAKNKARIANYERLAAEQARGARGRDRAHDPARARGSATACSSSRT